MEYVRYDPRRHRKPKALKAGWRAMRIYEALIDISAVYDLQGIISPDYANSDFIAGEVNLHPADWGFTGESGDMELALAISLCFAHLTEVGMLEKDGGTYLIKGWDEFYGPRKHGGARVGKFKELPTGTVVATQQNFSPLHHITSPTPPDTTPKGEVFTGQQLATLWNAWAAKHKLPQVTKLGGKRAKLAEARAKELPGESYWTGVLERIGQSPGLLGKNDRGWTASFDWLIEPMSAAKVMEGKYDKWGKAAGPGATTPLSARDAEDLYGA